MTSGIVLTNAMSVSLLAGAILGARHAVEADHLAAVATMVNSERHGPMMGLWWALGHMLPIAIGGLAAVALGLIMPTWVATTAETIVGVMLIGLGIISILPSIHVLSIDNQRSLTHRGSFVVGIVHGLAGSGAMILILTSTAGDIPMAVLFLSGVGGGSIFTMVLLAGLWSQLQHRQAALRWVAGLLSLLLGAGILAGVV